MAKLIVTAVPDFSQLNSAISKLNNKKVNIPIDSSQANAATQAIQNVDNAAKSANSSAIHYNMALSTLLKAQSKAFVDQQNAAAKQINKIQSDYQQMLAYAREYSAVAKENAQLTKNLSGKSAADSAAVFGIPPETTINRVIDKHGKIISLVKTTKDELGSVRQEYDKNGGLISVTRTYTDEMGNAVTETQQLQKTTHLLGDSLGNIILKMAVWQLLGNAISSVRRAFSGALETMKEVDDQLIVIRKTSGATLAELEQIENQAYKTASAYGVEVADYLESVSSFTRAGYRENAAALAELATKTQLVGDTTAETANQFLLAVDKGYQYNGSISGLSAVLDGADIINNKYATSLEKIAEGLGIVAPVAAQVNVGVDELTAAIGTITAVTQRSGSESARALRALFLNIVGDTKTEIDEGVTWTTGEIAGLQDVIKRYAKDAYEAAQATGQVIDPMEAIAGLAQSMKEGVLTEQELISMVSDIGGKLRSSQLLAIVQNWDMYESMLNDYRNAAGTADREIELAMDSWSRKQAQLKNEWSDFMRQMIETDAIKASLDGIIKLVQLLNTTVGRSVARGAAVTAAVAGVVTIVKALVTAVKGLNLAWMSGPLGLVFAGVAVGGIVYSVFDKLNVSLDEQREIVRQLNQEYEAQFGIGSEYEKLISKTEDLTDAEKERLAVLEAQRQAQERILSIEREREYAKYQNGEKTKTWFTDTTGNYVGLTQDEYRYRNFAFAKGEAAAYQNIGAMSSVIAEYKDAYDALKAYQEQGLELSEANQRFITEYESLAGALNALTEAEGEAADAASDLGGTVQDASDKFAIARGVIANVADAYNVLDTAQKEVDDTGVISISTLNTILDKYPELTKYLELTKDGYVLTKGALDDYIESEKAHYTLALNNAESAAQKVINAEALKAAGYDATTMSIKRQLAAMAALYQAKMDAYIAENGGDVIARQMGQKLFDPVLSSIYSAARELNSAEYELNSFNALANTLSLGGKSSATLGGQKQSSSGGSSSSSTNNTYLQNLKEAASHAKKEAQAARDAALDQIQDEIDALKKAKEEEEDALELEEKKADVLKKQNELLAARQERTIRQYNAKTGQWEWVEDATKVKSAKEALEEAEQALKDYQKELAYEAEVEALEARKDAINDLYEQLEDEIEKSLADLEEPIANLSDLFEELGIDLDSFGNALEKITDGAFSYDSSEGGSGGGFTDNEGNHYGPASTRIRSWRIYKPDGTIKYSDGTIRDKNGNILRYWDETLKPTMDSGGVLNGIGAIKATARNEIIIPPSVAEKMLEPSANQTFRQRMSELSFIYGGGGSFDAVMHRGGIGSVTNNNGSTYNLGGITLTERQARSTSVYELAQLAHGLRCYS